MLGVMIARVFVAPLSCRPRRRYVGHHRAEQRVDSGRRARSIRDSAAGPLHRGRCIDGAHRSCATRPSNRFCSAAREISPQSARPRPGRRVIVDREIQVAAQARPIVFVGRMQPRRSQDRARRSSARCVHAPPADAPRAPPASTTARSPARARRAAATPAAPAPITTLRFHSSVRAMRKASTVGA